MSNLLMREPVKMRHRYISVYTKIVCAQLASYLSCIPELQENNEIRSAQNSTKSNHEHPLLNLLSLDA